jgi:hypothetical protein
MITQQFLQSCTDEQINKGVAWLRFCGMVEDGDDWKEYIDLADIPKDPVWPEYCANPNDIMPIAFANGIGIRFSLDNGWIARNKVVLSYSDNPLRAICEVYILMSVNK